ncbi:MAG: DEAD/DEAH box helicase [Gammaproteobacteria bacterium]|nr:DEAD/DEAH box helicase [Gammaproteobacteria bacterium]
MSTDIFHPVTAAWFHREFAGPTPVQEDAWPAIKQRNHTLIAAPTGSGKTLAAFLAAIDDLVREALAGGLADETYILYVSPLKALSNDIQKNLQGPLQGVRDIMQAQGLPEVDIRALVRTGDTTQSERERMRRVPPHILVTTPESLYILLTSSSGRNMLQTVRNVIVDEIHALAPNKRGAHLALSLERLDALAEHTPVRIGLSATQRPIEEIARFLVGNREDHCNILDRGHARQMDIALELTDSPLEAVMAGEVWQELYGRLADLIGQHRTTLIFVNTRRLAERAARALAERVGEENVTAHHGSLAKEHRLNAEQRLKRGELKALVATASLELGIDIGDIDLVCQLGSPRSIAVFLQRVGRSGHHLGATPKGRLFPLSRDDLVECAALLDAARRDELDRLSIPEGHLDVLAQHLVAEAACGELQEDALFRQVTLAYPYRELTRQKFTEVLDMLAQGFSTRRGRRSRYIHHDTVNKRIRPRKSARLTAVTNGGVIPDQFDYDVVLEPEGHFIGTLNEDFAFESLPGDIFQLGNTSYRILKVEQSKVRVADAQGQPPNIPFWFGEAPGRSDELSRSVSRLRSAMDEKLARGGDAAYRWLLDEAGGLGESAARQLTDHLAGARAALGRIPTRQDIVFERFFDEAGDQHLVLHSPFGSRINRAWGLALRKRFCRQFNFELQAAALDDSIVISLGAIHSFPLEDATRYLKSAGIRETVTQALLATPMFPTHWRWNATTALAVRRNNGGQKVPAQFQRSDAEDLMAVVFPDQLACQDNLTGEREIPRHPLVEQTVDDCLHDLMDIAGLEEVLRAYEDGRIWFHCRDLGGPSPLAQEILNARPYAFLDDAPAEERRTNAVIARRFLDPADAADLARLSPAAIDRVRNEAWPAYSNPDELHDALMLAGVMTEREINGANPAQSDGRAWLTGLTEDGRATVLHTEKQTLWACAERLPQVEAVYTNDTDTTAAPPHAATAHTTVIPASPTVIPAKAGIQSDNPSPEAAPYSANQTKESALIELIRARLECSGPVTEAKLAELFEASATEVSVALLALQNEGYAMQGYFSPEAAETEWCERGLLARMHRYTIRSLREEIQPVAVADYMRFLFAWHGMGEIRPEGDGALMAALEKLEGYAIPAAAWEKDILPARLNDYSSAALDRLCGSGRIVWTRLNSERHRPNRDEASASKAVLLRNTPITLMEREHLGLWQKLYPSGAIRDRKLSSAAEKTLDVLRRRGASFFVDLVQNTGLLRTQVEIALAELAACGAVTSDSYAGLRALITPENRRPGYGQGRRRRRASIMNSVDAAGRWSAIACATENPGTPEKSTWPGTDENTLAAVVDILLKRYGVLFRKVLEREPDLPPWRELLYVCRRMEARGEIRGGYFVEGCSGEQFARPEAIALLRKQKNATQELPPAVISATDPLNLVGVILPGDRIPALHTNRVLFRNGLPVAKQLNGVTTCLTDVEPATRWEIDNLLTRRRNPAGFVDKPPAGMT